MTNWVQIVSALFLVAMVKCCSALTDAEKQTLLAIHNKLRAGEGASNMQTMKWNQDLAFMAQDWSNRCIWDHGVAVNASSLKDLNMGQNLYQVSGTTTIDLTSAVMSWFNEKADYNYASNTCNADKVCGHYTQVVWSESNLVGCGYAVCSGNSVILTCNYSPGGNVNNARPYQVGPACSQCSSGSFYCNSDNLCDKDCTSATCACKAACKNCGKQSADCKCQCGAGWTGVDCSVVCADTDKYCGANPGYPKEWCGVKTFVDKRCPAFCGYCVGGPSAPCP